MREGRGRVEPFHFIFTLSIIHTVSGILRQPVDFDSASNELYPPVESKITNIFKMFSALGKGSQFMLAMWAASCPEQNAALLSPKRGDGKWGAGTHNREMRDAYDLGTQSGPNLR